MEFDDLDRAAILTQKALKLDGNCNEAYYVLGKIALKKEQTSEGLMFLRQAFNLSPGRFDYCYEMAEINYNLKLYGSAKKYF